MSCSILYLKRSLKTMSGINEASVLRNSWTTEDTGSHSRSEPVRWAVTLLKTQSGCSMARFQRGRALPLYYTIPYYTILCYAILDYRTLRLTFISALFGGSVQELQPSLDWASSYFRCWPGGRFPPTIVIWAAAKEQNNLGYQYMDIS